LKKKKKEGTQLDAPQQQQQLTPRFAPNDRSSLDIHPLAIHAYILAITFHIPLLEVCRKAMHVLIIGQYCQALGLVEVIIPNTD
jgi:hypothetical protein